MHVRIITGNITDYEFQVGYFDRVLSVEVSQSTDDFPNQSRQRNIANMKAIKVI